MIIRVSGNIVCLKDGQIQPISPCCCPCGIGLVKGPPPLCTCTPPCPPTPCFPNEIWNPILCVCECKSIIPCTAPNYWVSEPYCFCHTPDNCRETPCPTDYHWSTDLCMCAPNCPAADCPRDAHWSPLQCQCVSNDDPSCIERACSDGWIWDTSICDCKEVCPTGTCSGYNEWDPIGCACVCQAVAPDCGTGKHFSREQCDCIDDCVPVCNLDQYPDLINCVCVTCPEGTVVNPSRTGCDCPAGKAWDGIKKECVDSPDVCELEQSASGNEEPFDQTWTTDYFMTKTGKIVVTINHYSVPDRTHVYFDGNMLYDTTCRGTDTEPNGVLIFEIAVVAGQNHTLRLTVNMDGDNCTNPGTAWTIGVRCVVGEDFCSGTSAGGTGSTTAVHVQDIEITAATTVRVSFTQHPTYATPPYSLQFTLSQNGSVYASGALGECDPAGGNFNYDVPVPIGTSTITVTILNSCGVIDTSFWSWWVYCV